MDEEKEKRMLKLQMRLNAARAANNKAVADEISRAHGLNSEKKEKKEDIFDIPIKQLEHQKVEGPTSEDHLKNSDVQKYLKQVKKIPQSVYTNYEKAVNSGKTAKTQRDYADPEMIEKIKKSLIIKAERSRERNIRAGNYDISGKTSVDFINDKNRRFNRKLARAFDEFTEETRLSIESGGNI